MNFIKPEFIIWDKNIKSFLNNVSTITFGVDTDKCYFTDTMGFNYPIESNHTLYPWSGLTDSYGDKIYEGTILQIKDTANAVVVWDKTSAQFTLNPHNPYSDWDLYEIMYDHSGDIEVIGHINTHPELVD